MPILPRLFVAFDLKESAHAALDDAQSGYLSRVLRLGLGAGVRLFNGRDGEWRAEISEVRRKSVVVTVVEPRRPQPAIGGPDIELWFAPVKKTRTDFIVEKATELGVSAIRPVITARTQSERVRTDRLHKIAIEAAEQTERMDVPRVIEAETLEAAMAGREAGRRLLFCDEAGDDPSAPWGGQTGRAQPILAAVREAGGAPLAVLVGPEGGFSPAERAWLRSLEPIAPVSLGPRILRAETAVVAALAVLQSAVGDWGGDAYVAETTKAGEASDP